MNNNKIAVITNSLSLGGAERISITLAEWFTNKGIEVVLITLNKDREEGYKLSPSIERLAINSESNFSKIKIIKELRKSIQFHKFNKVLVMGVPLAAIAIPASLGLNNNIYISERNDPANFKGKIITKFISRVFMIFADGFIFQTEGAKNYYCKFVKRKSVIIPNPLLVEDLPPVFKGLRRKDIVTAGRLVPQKNHELLIKAFFEVTKTFPEYTLKIYGNGPERDKLTSLINSLGLDTKVFLPGATNNLFEKIVDAELFVLSSNFEGMPNALIEAMALGIPCISTDSSPGGAREIIEHKKNGILVPVNNINELSDAIKFLISNKELARELSYQSTKIRDTLNRDLICRKWSNYIN